MKRLKNKWWKRRIREVWGNKEADMRGIYPRVEKNSTDVEKDSKKIQKEKWSFDGYWRDKGEANYTYAIWPCILATENKNYFSGCSYFKASTPEFSN